MGAFFGSIHIRTVDVGSVHLLLTALAAEKNWRFYLAPEKNGWVSVFPNENGQNAVVAELIAGRIDAEVLHLIDHDDSVFYYGFYRDGKRIDQFSSSESILEGENPRDFVGQPELFSPLFSESDRSWKTDKLRRILKHAGDHLFAAAPLKGFAALLRIPNVLTA